MTMVLMLLVLVGRPLVLLLSHDRTTKIAGNNSLL